MPCSAHVIRFHAAGAACTASDTAPLDGFDEWRETREDLDAILSWDERADQKATTVELPCLGRANLVSSPMRHHRRDTSRPVTTRARRRYQRQRDNDWSVPIVLVAMGSICVLVIGWLR